MWSVIKIDKKKISFFKDEIKKKLGEDCEFYIPKLHIEGIKNNKKVNKQIYLLGDYIFCFNNNFKNEKILQHLKNTKGLKYFLNGFISAQEEILQFIERQDDHASGRRTNYRTQRGCKHEQATANIMWRGVHGRWRSP